MTDWAGKDVGHSKLQITLGLPVENAKDLCFRSTH